GCPQRPYGRHRRRVAGPGRHQRRPGRARGGAQHGARLGTLSAVAPAASASACPSTMAPHGRSAARSMFHGPSLLSEMALVGFASPPARQDKAPSTGRIQWRDLFPVVFRRVPSNSAPIFVLECLEFLPIPPIIVNT